MFRDALIFIAGATFFHTLSHVMLPYFIQLPYEFNGITITSALNNWVIGINALITVGLLLWARKLKK